MTSAGEPVANRPLLAALCNIVMFFYAVFLGAMGVLLPFIGETFGLGKEAQGRLFPANFGGFIVGVLVCGYLSDRIGRKATLLAGIALYAGGLTLFGVAPNFGLALLASALVGAGSGAMEAVASALVADLYPERRAFLLAVIQVSFGLGASSSPSLSHTLLLGGTSWRTLYYALAAANVLLFLAIASQKVPRAAAHEAVDFATLRRVLQNPVFGMICLLQALYVGAEVGFFSWMPSYFEEGLPNGAAWAGRVATVFWISMTVGRFLTVVLVERIPLLRLILFLTVGGGIASSLTPFMQTPEQAMLCVALTGLFFSGMFSLILSVAGERFHTVAGTAFGGVVASGGLGGAVLPWVMGAITTSAVGWKGALLAVPLSLVPLFAFTLYLQKSPQKT